MASPHVSSTSARSRSVLVVAPGTHFGAESGRWLSDAGWTVTTATDLDSVVGPVDVLVVHEPLLTQPYAPSPHALAVRSRGTLVVLLDDPARVDRYGPDVRLYLTPPVTRDRTLTALDSLHRRTDYDEAVTALFSAASAVASLETTTDPATLERSPEWRQLTSRVAVLRKKADVALRELDIRASLEEILGAPRISYA